MSGNSIGKIFSLTTFGESHANVIGGVIDGCPSGLEICVDYIQKELNRRKPGMENFSSRRKEPDKIEFVSGVFEGKTTGTPIAFFVKNVDSKPEEYDHLIDIYRPSHADYTYDQKFGIRDYRGGGRASARETVARVVGGAVAKLLLKHAGITIIAYVKQIGNVVLRKNYTELDLDTIENNSVRCPDNDVSKRMINFLDQIKSEGDSTGGVVTCVIKNVPAGLGEPVFDKLHADLAKAVMSINSVKGFEYGSGFESASKKGSEHNDVFYFDSEKKGIFTKTNFSGGIQGGISNGNDIFFNVAFKPVPTINRTQETVDVNGRKVIMENKGRHDVCVVPRAVPIVEAMAAIVLADFYLRNRASKI